MINVTAIYNDEDQLCGFRTEGHAGYDKKGKDIVCAAVSALSLNVINSIEAFTQDKFSCKQVEDGFLELIMTEDISKESKLLLDSFFLGIRSISEDYGDTFVNLHIRR